MYACMHSKEVSSKPMYSAHPRSVPRLKSPAKNLRESRLRPPFQTPVHTRTGYINSFSVWSNLCANVGSCSFEDVRLQPTVEKTGQTA